ncbi:AAA family ATPase [Geotalea sp. SG265]|uniref:ExeA family protein n=1 Tax=Geotalea sp. SG265 TaxID=2922867 RepID=UPI001FAEEB83|nr:AAA family ATPase [Geotalea sp. SG265]
MYLDFFNLQKEPFNITPDPDLLFLSNSNKEALAAIIYGVVQRKGFVAITGQIGVGKTTIIRSFLESKYGSNLKIIYIFNANLSFKALLKTIFRNLGLSPGSEEVFEMVNELHQILIDLYKRGANVVLIVDEAQNMPVETLRALHMLSNLETTADKLIQVVLCGQPELDDILDGHLLRQLKQRIAIRAIIQSLTKEESLAYIRHRLSKTAVHGAEIFTAGALKEIIGKANGIPRVINTLCDNCLITSFGRQERRVTQKLAREIIRETASVRPVNNASRRNLAVVSLVAAMMVLFVFADDVARVVQSAFAAKNMQGQIRTQPAAPVAPLPPGSANVQSLEEPKKLIVSKVVRKGDTLARLVNQTYGSVNDRLIGMVLDINPQILDRDQIKEGEKIAFPPPDN